MSEPSAWNVLVECVAPDDASTIPNDDDRWDQLVDALEPYDGVVGYSPDRYSVRFFIDADTAMSAAFVGWETVLKTVVNVGLPEWPCTQMRVMTEAEFEAELAAPQFPALLGAAELAGHLHVSRQRLAELRQRPGFPTPIVSLASGPIWLLGAVDTFVADWERQPGRPRKTSRG